MPQDKQSSPAEEKGDARMDAPTFHRNHRPIIDVLTPYLVGQAGDALEIASGSGQHTMAFAAQFPSLTWWPTDIGDEQLHSIAAWRRSSGLANVQQPFLMDASAADWEFGVAGRPPSHDLTAIVAINVMHISPWAVSEGLFSGAGRYLAKGGHLFIYGPFRHDGVFAAESNAAFDASLRQRNPKWGVRDIRDIVALAERSKLAFKQKFDVPANNNVLVFAPVS